MYKMEKSTVIKYPLSTEKSIRIMEAENKLAFIVDRSAKKAEIKSEIERLFKVKVEKVQDLLSTASIVFGTEDEKISENSIVRSF